MIRPDGRKKRDAKANGNSLNSSYKIYCGIRYRCSVQGQTVIANTLYAKLGVTMSKSWADSFENFLRDMGERPGARYSIDRVDGFKGYCKHNCRWATKGEQSLNRRVNKKRAHWPVGISWNAAKQRFHVRRNLRGYEVPLGDFESLAKAKQVIAKFNKTFADLLT